MTGDPVSWHTLTAEEACARVEVDRLQGLDDATVTQRRAKFGSNKLAEEKKEPGWKAFAAPVPGPDAAGAARRRGRQHRRPPGLQHGHRDHRPDGPERGDGAEPGGQGGRERRGAPADADHDRRTRGAADSGSRSRPRSSSRATSSGSRPATRCRPTAGCWSRRRSRSRRRRSPARARRSPKSVDPVAGDDVPLGDRIDMAYMNSQVTRGRGEMVVTATGMSTEVGHISGMLSDVEQEKTPLTKQLDQLTVLITIMAALALVLIVVLGLARGEDFDALFLDRHQPRDRRDPDRPSGRRHDAAVDRHAGARGEGRDRQAPAVGGDARLDVGDLLGQDRHADAEPDDGPPARARRPPVQRRRRGLLDRGQDPAGGGRLATSRSSRSCCRWRWPTTP